VEFRVLGTVEATEGGCPVDLGHARQRCVLAVLLVEANRRVPVEQLIDRVWGERVPQRGRAVLHGYLSRLRSVLAGTGDAVIERRPGGYVLTVDESLIDLHRYRRLLARARAETDDERALALFEEAVGLWRDTAFADLDTEWLASVRTALEAERHAGRLDRTEVALRRGRHTELLAGLTTDAERYPLDERVAAQLMLALYRSGRQADALRHYERVRERLAEELGTDPGPPLRQLHQRILTSDPHLTGPQSAPRPTAAPVPRQLPAPPPWFTGRERELSLISSALRDAKQEGSTVLISALAGTGGVGKTWLALHWAHRRLHEFPDGQMFVDLQGFSPAGDPMPPSVAVRGFLDGLGVDPGRIPPDSHAQAALYRSLVADRRMLIVLDNAADAAQVTPLLPGSATCTVVVTSRQHLTSLVARHGALHVRVGELGRAEAHRLLVTRLGAERVGAEPDAVDTLLRCCAGFPLALGIVAGHAHTAPHVTLTELAADLLDTTTRLGGLDDDDPGASLPAILSWSVRALTGEQARVFGLLGIAPGPDIGAGAASALTGLSTVRTAVVLRGLEQASLLDRDDGGRYRMHDLVRLYAREHATTTMPEPDRTAAVRRVIDFYLHTAHAADRRLNPHRQLIEPDPPSAGCRPWSPADDTAALAWFDAERPCLLAAFEEAVARDWHAVVWHLARAMTTFHSWRGHLADDVAGWQAGLAAADHLADHAKGIMAHRNLGNALTRTGRGTEALEQLREGLALAFRAGELVEQGAAHHALAVAHERREEHRSALEHATRALEVFQGLGDPIWEANALNTVGWCAAQVGDYEQAASRCQAALDLHREHDNRDGQAMTLDSLGFIAERLGCPADAIGHYEESLALFRTLGESYEMAGNLDELGRLYVAVDRPEQARAAWQEAEGLYRTQSRTADAERTHSRLAELADTDRRG
jgi:DNA-binding SARP family transcriptional activator